MTKKAKLTVGLVGLAGTVTTTSYMVSEVVRKVTEEESLIEAKIAEDETKYASGIPQRHKHLTKVTVKEDLTIGNKFTYQI